MTLMSNNRRACVKTPPPATNGGTQTSSRVGIVVPGADMSEELLELDELTEFSHRLRMKLAGAHAPRAPSRRVVAT